MFRRRRPLLRTAAAAGGAYYAGKKAQEARDEDLGPGADEPAKDDDAPAGISDESIDRLEKLGELREQGVLSEAEFEAEKKKVLGT